PGFLDHQRDNAEAHLRYSKIGRSKPLYRECRKNRYGSLMQAIAGGHFNISFPNSFWKSLQTIKGDTGALQDFILSGYLGLIRNFKRELWLFSYLFGESTALCNSFLHGISTGVPFKKIG
ncbi:glutamate--cysteine ligase, partial [Pseudoalteromonas sp. S1727]